MLSVGTYWIPLVWIRIKFSSYFTAISIGGTISATARNARGSSNKYLLFVVWWRCMSILCSILCTELSMVAQIQANMVNQLMQQATRGRLPTCKHKAARFRSQNKNLSTIQVKRCNATSDLRPLSLELL